VFGQWHHWKGTPRGVPWYAETCDVGTQRAYWTQQIQSMPFPWFTSQQCPIWRFRPFINLQLWERWSQLSCKNSCMRTQTCSSQVSVYTWYPSPIYWKKHKY
jgi:hypothetical protein